MTNHSLYDKIFRYCGATVNKVRLGQSEPCKIYQTFADMAELADAYGSGPYVRKDMQVQVLLSAPSGKFPQTSSRLTVCGALFFHIERCNERKLLIFIFRSGIIDSTGEPAVQAERKVTPSTL